ncbi:condensation domain-containing protein [Streptomyces sp. ME19-01-6]|uniref:condensation domain-containing protein n=1 Tax=Streptomyces sp. ME19-01-6 TaxID=3028686 RepID=UPI0029AC0F10|nr:condensation domain-containing protein [Streptomyces sp. ME19-01-6]MDX3231465.1 condensation domain-containing protein [Streptomyces sp. ME19-01-6]
MTGAETFGEEVVEFGGLRAVRAPLTWGQQVIYRALQSRANRAHYDYNQRMSLPVPKGRSLREVIDAVRALVTAHESLRTVYRDGTADSASYQEVRGEGRLTVRVVHGDDPVAALDALAEADFDLSREWGIRVAVLTGPGGVPRHLALYVSHLAVDGWAMGLVVRRLKALLADDAAVAVPAEAVPAPPVPQPADLAETERSEAGRTADRRADAYQRSLLRRAPRTMFPARPPASPAPADTEGPSEWAHGEFRSGRLEAAAREVAARCRAGEETVYLAAVGTLLARRAGLSHCVLKTIFANRIGAERQAMVAPLASDVLLCFEVSGPSFDDCVRAAHLAKLRGYARAQYDPGRLERLVAEVGRERGEQLDLSVLHNDLGALAAPEADGGGRPARGPGGVETSFRWAEPFRLPSVKLYCSVRTADRGERVIGLAADTRYLPGPDLRGLLYGVEELVVNAASGPRERRGEPRDRDVDERLSAHVS